MIAGVLVRRVCSACLCLPANFKLDWLELGGDLLIRRGKRAQTWVLGGFTGWGVIQGSENVTVFVNLENKGTYVLIEDFNTDQPERRNRTGLTSI